MLRKPTESLVIKPRLSAPVRLAIALAAILVVAGASLAGYWGGRSMLYQRLESNAQEIQALQEVLSESQALNRELEAEAEAARARLAAEFQAEREQLQSELESARERLANTRNRLEESQSSLTRVTRQLQIDQTAYSELRKELEASDRQITELAGELKFYRSIISPADGRSGVRIQEFRVQPTATQQEFRYRLTLIQALEHEDTVKGVVRFEVTGSEDGETRTFHSPTASREGIPVEFKYFQNFAGIFDFPAGFMPAEVKVIFEAEDEAVVQRTYPWPGEDTPGNS
jgi:hypothetical protein